jgi:hypothetical protein
MKGLERHFRCQQCGERKAELDARRALGFFG